MKGPNFGPVGRRSGRALLLLLAAAFRAEGPGARGENLGEAWAIAPGTDQRLQASRQTTEAAGHDLASARGGYLPRVQTLDVTTFLTNPISVPSSSGQPTTTPATSQQNFTISAVAASVPLYSGGRVRRTVAANRAQLNASRADQASTAQSLKLDVARAYVGVLRAGRGVAVSQSSVASLSAQARDVANLVKQGRGIRNDLLAAQVASANARQREIQARNTLTIAWATYNRYLCRPPTTVVPLEELAPEPPPPPPGQADAVIAEALLQDASPIVADEPQIQALVDVALRCRPELASASEQASSYYAQAAAERAKTRPQVSFVVANLYQNARFLPTQADSGAAAFLVNWTLFDGGQSRRHSQALEHRGYAQLNQRADLASQIALQVRSSWLTAQEARRRIPVARAAIVQAEENFRVARSRYIQQRGTNTEVIDAENARVQSYDNYFNAFYDSILAEFDLHRATGEI